jgi:UDP-glucose 4-epimerase
MAKCLVTGGCGFIGSHLVEALVAQGHSVRVLDDLSTGRKENLFSIAGRVELLEGSITDLEAVRVAAHGAEWVFHLAALPSVDRSLIDPRATHAVCATGTLNVLEAAREEGVRRVIYAASSSAYGDAPGVLRRENDPCRPLSPYAAAKLAGEHYCQSYMRSFGLETVRLRLFNVFGPRQDAGSAYAVVVARFVKALCHGQLPVIHGDGLQTRDFTYVDNAVAAMLLAAESYKAPGNVFNVGAGGRTNLRQLARKISKLVGKRVQPIFGEARQGDVRHSRACLVRAQRDLGYEPSVSLEEGLRRTVAACRADPVQAPCAAGQQAALAG